MSFARTILLALFSFTLSLGAADEPFAIEKPLSSPLGTFTITQHRDGNWTTQLHFKDGTHPDIVFTDDYPWPALFYISPNDQWILQIQKSGSGDNISFLYRVESNGRLWRMEQRFGEMAFTFLEHTSGVSFADLYHTGIEFEGWDMKAGLLYLSIHGSSVSQSGKGVERKLVYNLTKHSFRVPSKQD